MKKILELPVLDQMYEFRKVDFEQAIYDENDEVKTMELEILRKAEDIVELLKEVIPISGDADKVIKLFEKYQLEYLDSIDFWCKTYFKLGMIERDEIKKAFWEHKLEKNEKENDTFLNFPLNCLSEYIETQKRKYTLDTPEYKKLMERYREISEKYPNTIAVFEDLEPIVLNKDEMKALVELREIDLEIGSMEKDLCFKLGMKEVINF